MSVFPCKPYKTKTGTLDGDIDDARRDLSKCHCRWVTRVLGDGCQYCNPKLAKEMKDLVDDDT
jgi:hypothetical protein